MGSAKGFWRKTFQFSYNVLFYYTILVFPKSNLLTSFNLLPSKYWGSTHPHVIFQRSKDVVSFLKYGDIFYSKKVFMASGEQIFLGKFMEAILQRGLVIRSCQGRESFKCISQYSKDFTKLKFSQSCRNINWMLKPWPIYRIMERFILEVNDYNISKIASCSA